MQISQDSREITSAFAVQSRCELKRILLSSCEALRNGDETDFQSPFELKFAHECLKTQIHASRLVIELRFSFEGKDSSESERSMFRVGCGFELIYDLHGKVRPTDEEIDAFKKGNAVFNCWPYVREFVQQTAARMGFQPPPIPLLRIQPKLESEDVPPAVTPQDLVQHSSGQSKPRRNRSGQTVSAPKSTPKRKGK